MRRAVYCEQRSSDHVQTDGVGIRHGGIQTGMITGMIMERNTELREIRDVIVRATHGSGSAIFFQGDPGLGKTELLAAAIEICATPVIPIRASGHVMETGVPFSLAQQMVEQLAQHCRPHPELSEGLTAFRKLFRRRSRRLAPDDGSWLRAELTYSFYWLFASAAERFPLLLCLDDLHWADRDSLSLLSFFLRRMAGLAVAVVGGFRGWPHEAGAAIRALGQEAPVQLRTLAPLSENASRSLVRRQLGSEPSLPLFERIHSLARGNPLLLVQALLLLDNKNADGAVLTTVEASHRAIILARLDGLPEQTRRLLLVASVLGTRFAITLAAELADLAVDAATALLEPAAILGILRPCDDALEPQLQFVHPLVWWTLYDSLADGDSRSLHQRTAQLLRKRGADDFTLAYHLTYGADVGDRNAAATLFAMAAQAEGQGAFDTATEYLSRAAKLCRPGADRAKAHFALGNLAQKLGDMETASHAYDEAFANMRRESEAGANLPLRNRIRRAQAFVSLATGNPDRARRGLAEALREARSVDTPMAVATAIEGAVLELTSGTLEAAATLSDEAVELARKAGDRIQIARAEAVVCHVAFTQGSPAAYEGAVNAYEAGRPWSPDDTQFLWGWSPEQSLGIIASRLGRYVEAEERLTEVLSEDLDRRSLMGVIWQHTFLAELDWRRGHLRDAYDHISQAKSRTISVPWAKAMVRHLEARILMDIGDLDGARSALREAEQDAEQGVFQTAIVFCRWANAVLLARECNHAAAAEHFLQGMPDLDVSHPQIPCCFFSWWETEAADSCVRAGMFQQARTLISRIVAAGETVQHPGLLTAGLRCRALLADRMGDEQAAQADFEQAYTLCPALDDWLERGRLLLDLGAWHRRHRRLSEARAPLREAMATFSRCGSVFWREQALAELQSAHGRIREPDPTDRLHDLTSQEYRIAKLVSENRTNREIALALFISPKTLGIHLGNIYRKLNLSSRDELRAYATLNLKSQGSKKTPANEIF